MTTISTNTIPTPPPVLFLLICAVALAVVLALALHLRDCHRTHRRDTTRRALVLAVRDGQITLATARRLAARLDGRRPRHPAVTPRRPA